jgi:hypothetical protein
MSNADGRQEGGDKSRGLSPQVPPCDLAEKGEDTKNQFIKKTNSSKQNKNEGGSSPDEENHEEEPEEVVASPGDAITPANSVVDIDAFRKAQRNDKSLLTVLLRAFGKMLIDSLLYTVISGSILAAFYYALFALYPSVVGKNKFLWLGAVTCRFAFETAVAVWRGYEERGYLKRHSWGWPVEVVAAVMAWFIENGIASAICIGLFGYVLHLVLSDVVYYRKKREGVVMPEQFEGDQAQFSSGAISSSIFNNFVFVLFSWAVPIGAVMGYICATLLLSEDETVLLLITGAFARSGVKNFEMLTSTRLAAFFAGFLSPLVMLVVRKVCLKAAVPGIVSQKKGRNPERTVITISTNLQFGLNLAPALLVYANPNISSLLLAAAGMMILEVVCKILDFKLFLEKIEDVEERKIRIFLYTSQLIGEARGERVGLLVAPFVVWLVRSGEESRAFFFKNAADLSGVVMVVLPVSLWLMEAICDSIWMLYLLFAYDMPCFAIAEENGISVRMAFVTSGYATIVMVGFFMAFKISGSPDMTWEIRGNNTTDGTMKVKEETPFGHIRNK